MTELGSVGGTDQDTFATAVEWADARENEIELRRDILQVVRTVEQMREAGTQDADQIKVPDPPDFQAAAAELARSRGRQALAESAWNSLGTLPAARRLDAAIFICRCPDRCLLVEIHPRRAVPSSTDEWLLVVAHGTQSQVRIAAGDAGQGSLAFACRHGRGRFPLRYATRVRRSGPPARRRVNDLAGDESTGVTWRPRQKPAAQIR